MCGTTLVAETGIAKERGGPRSEKGSLRSAKHLWVAACTILIPALLAATASAAAPAIQETWSEAVSSTAATLHARLDAGGLTTSYRFEYVSEADYAANLRLGREGFFGATRVPEPDANAGKASGTQVAQQIRGLQSEAVYRYRVAVQNSDGSTVGPERVLTTRGTGGPLVLPDDRGWEMVSPIDKNGGEVPGFGGAAGGGVLQAGSQGGIATFSAVSSFAGGGQGSPGGNQYISRRLATGWSTENVTPATYGGAYGDEPNGVPYQLFSPDLRSGLLEGIAGLPMSGTAAPAGYANYYLRDASGSFTALLRQESVGGLSQAPGQFRLAFAGASPDLGHVVLSSCSALTDDATEVVASGGGCEAASPNLYEWSASDLRLVNVLPGHSTGTPPALLAARSGAVSDDGSRIYWTDGSNLYLWDRGRPVQVDAALGGGGVFQTATPDGAVAFFVKGEHLYAYSAATEATTEVTPSGGVKGVLGAASDGSRVYFATAEAIFVAREGTISFVVAAPDPGNFPPDTGSARVTADGTRLLFASKAELTPYDNDDAATGEPDAELYLYDVLTGALTCVSCNPTGERPNGSASVPGAVANGTGEGATRAYKPRVLSTDGLRVFFDSPDSLVLQDTDRSQDVYEWEAAGTGTCAKPRGCVQLISSGRGAGGASFADASADGGDVFFLTAGSLVKADPGAVDLYDAREGGGFPEPEAPIPCEEDACQPLPSPPEDPSPGSLVQGSGNPPVHFQKQKKAAKARSHKRHRAKHRARKRSRR